MLGWRRRSEGFEWREYVRTTILVRRKERRDRVVRAGKAAVEGLKAAGERGAAAGAVGAEALGRGAKVAARQGMAIGVAGARAADDRLRTWIPRALKLLGAFASRALAALAAFLRILRAAILQAWEMAAPLLEAAWYRLAPALAPLRKPGIAATLALVAGVAFVGSVRRIAANGFTGDIFVALLIGTVITCALIGAWLAEGAPAWLIAALRGTGHVLGSVAEALRDRLPASTTRRRAASIVALAGIVVGAGWLLWRGAASLPSLIGGTTQEAAAVEGRAVAMSGDTLRVARTTVAIAGIEAPLDGQTCGAERRWRCDVSAKAALARLAGRGTVRCDLARTDAQGRRIGTCRIGEKDIAAELVRNGHVFALASLFSGYGALEEEARAAKLGIWRGESERPADYRAQKWQDAKREAPDGCPIKGNVKGGERIYVLPWARDYARVRVSRARGGRWFCSESEAQAAGWKPSDRS